MLSKKLSLGTVSKVVSISLLSLIPFCSGLALPVSADSSTTYKLIKTITGPNIPPTNLSGNNWCSDINWYDTENKRYYLADANNKQVDVVDTKTNTLLAPIGTGDFTGPGNCLTYDYSQEGPTGILTDKLGQLWVGNGDSTVHVYNADTGKPIAVINTQGTRRADEMAYDAADKQIIVTNPDEALDGGSPFVTVIDAVTHKVVPHGKFHIPNATALEQPQWNPKDGLFYISIPTTTTSAGGEVAVIDPLHLATKPVIKAFADGDCNPSGLAINVDKQEIALGCSTAAEIMDIKNGMIDTRISQITNVDEVWYNEGDQRFYFGSYGSPTTVGVVNANNHTFVTNIPVGDPNEHAAAVSSATNEVYVPVSGKGIEVFKAKDDASH